MDKTILVCDQDREALFSVEETLAGTGADIVCADTPGTALEACARRRFDAVLIDGVMASLGDWALIAKIRQLTSAPIVMMTSGEPRRDLTAYGVRLGLGRPVPKADPWPVLSRALELA